MYNETSNFSGSLGPANQHFRADPFAEVRPEIRNGNVRNGRARTQDQSFFHGEALARDIWAEHYAPWVVLSFAAAFSLFLILMALAGQAPGKSFLLKSISDILQFVGEGLGFVFCARIALRLQGVSSHLRRELLQKSSERRSPNELAVAHTEAQAAQRAFLAWGLLACGIALYASGQAIWTSYDIRMNSADVPYPGIYDIGFMLSYPFFLIGTLFLTRRNKASVGRIRLILDALGIIGASLALSWFFVLSPAIAGLAQAPSSGAAFLSVYFPSGDLFLVAIGAFLMFSPLSNRAQQPVFMLLCMGLFFLAITDSLLGYYSVSGGFNTGTVQDVLWPLSMALIGLAAIEYPRSVAREQEQVERTKNSGLPISSLLAPGKFSQFSTTAQTISPFILVLGTCALLLTNVASHGGTTLVEADFVALALILIVIARQALTLLENNKLTMQMRGELVISRRELQVTRREADEATRSVQDKQVMEQGIATLREVHARVARGDLLSRAPTIPGPLLPIAISLNLMLDRLSALSQRGAKYDQLIHDCKLLQEGVERLSQGMAPWQQNQAAPKSAAELRAVFLSLAHVQRLHDSQWRRMETAVESMHNLTRRIREALSEIRRSSSFNEMAGASFERMAIERVAREADLLGQQQRTILNQIMQITTRNDHALAKPMEQEQSPARPSYQQQAQVRRPVQPQEDLIYGQNDEFAFDFNGDLNLYNDPNAGHQFNRQTPSPEMQNTYNPYSQRMPHQQRVQRVPMEE